MTKSNNSNNKKIHHLLYRLFGLGYTHFLLRRQARRKGIKVYKYRNRAIIKAIMIKLFSGLPCWVEKHPAGFQVWNHHQKREVNKSIMKQGAQKIRERDISKVVIYKTW